MSLEGTIYDPNYWFGEDAQLYREVGPFVLRLMMAGARAGIGAMPPAFELLINWDTFNTSAVSWLQQYEANWLRGINQTTRTNVVKVIENWIVKGDPLPVLASQLEPFFGAERAEMIAATEVTRVYAEGNLQAWKSTGFVGGKMWQTAVDDRVCPICGPLHGKIVSIDSGWSADEKGKIIDSSAGILSPPAHIRCRCWLLPVVNEAAFDKRLDEVLRGSTLTLEQKETLERLKA